MRERWEEAEVKLYGKRVVSPSRDPRCNGVIGYELTGPRSLSWRGSRRRKLVEGNRFITRDRHRGRRRRAEHERESEERNTARGFARSARTTTQRGRWRFLPLSLLLCVSGVYTHRALYVVRVFFVLFSTLVSFRVFAVFLRRLRAQHVDERRSRNTQPNRARSIPSLPPCLRIPRQTVPSPASLQHRVSFCAGISHARSGSPLARFATDRYNKDSHTHKSELYKKIF